MTSCPTPVPYCIDTADSFLAKIDKTNSFSFLIKVTMELPLPIANVLTIEESNALFYYLKEIQDNVKQIIEKLYSSIIKSDYILTSTDMYSATSVKSL